MIQQLSFLIIDRHGIDLYISFYPNLFSCLINIRLEINQTDSKTLNQQIATRIKTCSINYPALRNRMLMPLYAQSGENCQAEGAWDLKADKAYFFVDFT